ncbi:E3 ubiquitin-protein ligase RNF4 isoform X2 [Drosophila guanche]|nr:E3 ubiquitin-protein ligase RNF4 isoform X2 [Drosophila guanche]SPP82852.1 blast:E3 ubiquitin-protein ligase RNF125 [Drosophila guanche]
MNSVGYSASVDDDESDRDAGLSLDDSGRDAGLSLDDSRLNSRSIDISQVEAEIDRINRYCEQIGANSGNETSVSNTSTPTVVRRVFRSNSPVEVIDLLNVDNSIPRAAIGRSINRVPEAVIDLCTPDRSIVPTATIDLDDSDFVPTNRRRNHASSSTPTTARATLNIDDSAPSSPKRKRNEQNVSSNEDVYKCPVCLECVRHREPVSTKCGHVFCRPCIETAIRTTHKCPMCNKKLTIRQTTRIYL